MLTSRNNEWKDDHLVTIIGVLTMLAPFGVFYTSYTLIGGPFILILTVPFGLALSGFGDGPTILFNLQYLFLSVLLSSLRFVFAYSVVRYSRRNLSKKTCYITGVLSLIPLIVYGFIMMPYTIGISYVGPLPILFLFGLFKIRNIQPIVLTSPFEDNTSADL